MDMRRFTHSFDAVFLTGDNPVVKTRISGKNVYQMVVWILLILSVFLLIRLAPILTKPEYLPNDDFVRFWASGKLNLQHENPYDSVKMEQLHLEEGSQAPSNSTSSVVLNPPWVIPLLMPFGVLSYRISRLTWLIISIALLILSSQILWRIYSGKPKQQWIAIIFIFIFAPTISVLEKGQITPLVIVGITGFMYFSVYHRNDWLAGMFLALASIKPQLIIIFWIALLFWVIIQRRWLIAISTIITILTLTVISMIFNPHIIQQYFGMLQTGQVTEWASPTIGAYLRLFWLGTDRFWLQFLPSLLAVIWFIIYWNRHYKSWNWVDELPIVLLISQLTSPYSWTYDLVILIPVVILAAVWMSSDLKSWSTFVLILVFIAINALDLLLHMKLDEFWFIWLTPALFIWFFLVRWIYQNKGIKQLVTTTG
jgi:Glycosyltransferase family 87